MKAASVPTDMLLVRSTGMPQVSLLPFETATSGEDPHVFESSNDDGVPSFQVPAQSPIFGSGLEIELDW